MLKWGPWFIIGITVLWAGGLLTYELLALSNKHPGDTISELVWTLIKGRPWLSALLCIGLLSAFGLLMGHFFWQARS